MLCGEMFCSWHRVARIEMISMTLPVPPLPLSSHTFTTTPRVRWRLCKRVYPMPRWHLFG